MKHSHTPVPWLAYEADKTWTIAPSQTDATVIAEVGTTVRSGTLYRAKVSKANAQLISAAPDMLEALRNAGNVLAALATRQIKHINRDSYALQMVRAAIAKAEGNPQ